MFRLPVSTPVLAGIALLGTGCTSAPLSAAGQASAFQGKRDSKAVVRVDRIHAVFKFDVGNELKKAGMSSAVGFMPAFESSEMQDVTYTATIDGKPIELVKDIRGRDVFMIRATPSTRDVTIDAHFEVPVLDKGGNYKASTPPTLSASERALALRSDDGWFNFKDPQFKAGLERRGLIRKPGESEYDFVCRFQDYLRANSRYSEDNVNHPTAADSAVNFRGGDCKDYTFFGLNVLRFNGIPALGEITFPVNAGGNGFHASIRYFGKESGWCATDFAEACRQNTAASTSVAKSQPLYSSGGVTILTTGHDMHYGVQLEGTRYSLGGFMHGFKCFGPSGSKVTVIPTITHDFRGSGK